MTKRECGDCQLCCKLLPMKDGTGGKVSRAAMALVDVGLATASQFADMAPDFYKPAGERCPHQKHHKGCSIYDRRPFGCRVWSCRWLLGDDTGDMSRPDRAHYVIDVMPDAIGFQAEPGGEVEKIPVVQIWIDPKHPEAINDPSLRAYIERRAEEGIAALCRWNASDATTVFAPAFDAQEGKWHEIKGGHVLPEGSMMANERVRMVVEQ